MERRDFIKAATVGAAITGSLLPVKVAAKTDKTYSWRMTTTWPPKYPIWQDACERLVKHVETMSQGRLRIQLYAAGELIPALQAFDAVQQGSIQVASSTPYYWSGKISAAQFFSAVPFGFNFQQQVAWLYQGGGLELWQKLYAPQNMIVFPMLTSGHQMGGWFRREITSLKDLKGLKIRMPGLGGKVLAEAGADVVLLPPGEIYLALERGVIDATEWIGPYLDMKMGLYQAAKYYYYPGWHEAGTLGDVMINKSAWDSLTPDLQEIMKSAAVETLVWSMAANDALNSDALKELVNKHGVKLRKFPDDVLQALRRFSRQVLEQKSAKDPKFKEVYESFLAFKKRITPWAEISERTFYDHMMG